MDSIHTGGGSGCNDASATATWGCVRRVSPPTATACPPLPGTSGGTPRMGGSVRTPEIGLVGAWPIPASVRRVGLTSSGGTTTSAPTGDVRRVVSRQRASVSRASPADVRRLAGSRASRRCTSATRSPGQSSGSAGGPLSICVSTSRSLPWNGGAPASSSHSTTPSDQQSLIVLTWPSIRRSGDM